MVCKTCGVEFIPYRGKPGFINQCGDCGEEIEVPVVGGNMVWAHKTAPELEIKPMVFARSFAKATRRFGVGPLRSIVEGREECLKAHSGAEPGAVYHSHLGEKRSVKR